MKKQMTLKNAKRCKQSEFVAKTKKLISRKIQIHKN